MKCLTCGHQEYELRVVSGSTGAFCKECRLLIKWIPQVEVEQLIMDGRERVESKQAIDYLCTSKELLSKGRLSPEDKTNILHCIERAIEKIVPLFEQSNRQTTIS